MKFCGECGARLTVECAECGARTAPNQKFCAECGARLAVRAAAPEAESPETYTPRHLAAKIRSAKDALEGERKQVTVLFADLKGSTELLAHRDPEDARRILDPVLERMMAAVHRYEGTVNQVMGDGIMALFGAPLAHEDHAVRACYAALSMQESVRSHADEVQRTEGLPIQIRIGLNSGEVVVRSIASDLQMDYTAVGQSTHLAARMEQMATPGSIFIAQNTARLAEGFIAVRSVGPLPVKGFDEPVEVYELTGAGASRSRLQASAARGLTRFVGRNGELEDLRQAAELAATGHGQVIAVIGEPGVGKSRLLWEFLHSPLTGEWRVVESRSVSYGTATNYLPIAEFLKDYFQIEGQEATLAADTVRTTLLARDPALEPMLAPLLWLLDLPVEDAAWLRLDPPQRRRRVMDAVKRLVLGDSRRLPVLAVFEDLHWIDAETQSILDSLVESLPAANCLMLVNYRPEYHHTWGRKTYYRQVLIDTLAAKPAGELLGALVGNDPSVEALKGLLVERTDGNPFFLEESVLALVETGYLTGQRGAYQLAKPTNTLRIPESATAVLAARVDRLELDDKHLLQAAAVVGKDVPFDILAAVAQENDDDLGPRLARLQTAEFLYELSLFPDLEYTFKHALTHEVVYASLLRDRRRALHAAVVEAIEQLYPDQLVEHVEQLAHHAFRGEVWEKAVPYLRQAALKVMTRSGYREAVDYLEQALSVLPRLPATPQASEWAIDLRFDLRNALFPLAELGEVGRRLDEAEPLCVALGDRRRLALVSGYLTHYLWLTGQTVAARVPAQRLAGLAAEVNELPLLVAADYYRSAAWFGSGDTRCERYAQQVVRRLQGDQMLERFGLGVFPAAFARAFLAFIYTARGEFSQGLAFGGEALRLAETVDHPYSVGFNACMLGNVHLVKGDFDRAAGYFERGHAVSHEWGLAIMDGFNTVMLGYSQAMMGQAEQGLVLLRPAMELMKKVVLAPLCCVLMGEALLVDGQTGEARSWAGLGLRLSRERDERIHEAHALWLLAEIGGATNDDPRAVELQYNDCIAKAESIDMHPLVAHGHAGLAKLLRRIGNHDDAQAHFTLATTKYREMGMSYWLAKAEAEMAADHT